MTTPDTRPTPALWQAGHPAATRAVLSTGHAPLDAALADGGWPRGALAELLAATPGSGELPLLMPALAAHAGTGGWIVLVAPPYVPCAGAWLAAGIDTRRVLWLTPADARTWLWSTEQAARTAGCAVLAWPHRHPAGMRELRRLQLAAQQGDGLCVLLRDDGAARQASPAALRLRLSPAGQDSPRGQVVVEILKQRGGFGGRQVTLPLATTRALPRLAPWQLPVHRPGAASTPDSGHTHAVAGHPFARPAAGMLDAPHAPTGADARH